MKNRRSLTPENGVPAADGAHAMRRGGARHEVTERIRVVGPNLKAREGWVLNVSRGGVRAMFEDRVEPGEEYEVNIGEEGPAPLSRRGRVVWVQEEPDGVIAGFEFLFLSGQQPAVPGPPGDGPPDGPDGPPDDPDGPPGGKTP